MHRAVGVYVVVVAAGSPLEEMGLGHPAAATVGATVGATAGATAGLVGPFDTVVKFDWILIVNPRGLLLLFIYLITLV